MTGDAARVDAAALPEATLAALPFGLWAYDREERLAFANPAAREMLGLEPGLPPPGTPLREVVRLLAWRGALGPGDPQAQAAQHLALDRSRPFRRLLRRADGGCLELHGAPLPGGGFCSILAEVTPYLAAAEEAARQARRLEAVLAQLHGGLAVYDAEERLALHNPAYEDLLGLPRGTVRPGMTRDEVLRLLAGRGEFANLDAEAVVAERRGADRTARLGWQRERPGGQVLRFESQPMPEGGTLLEVTDITAARRAEDEARRRAALLDGVLEAMPHGVVVFGPDGRVAMVNAAHQRIMAGSTVEVGEHRDEITRRRALSGEYGPGDPEELARRHLVPRGEPLGEAGSDRSATRQRVRPDGTAIDIRYAALPDGGRVQVTTDITELHRARAEATERAALLQVMLDSMRHGIALFDAERRLVAANALAARMIGLPPDRLRPGRTLAELIEEQIAAGEFAGSPEDTVRAKLGGDRGRPMRYTRTRPDGTVLEVFSDPTPDGGFVCTYSDITARAQAEAETRGQAAMLRATIDNLRYGLILYGPDRRVRVANALSSELAGYPPGTVRPGRSLEEMIAEIVELGALPPGPDAELLVRRALEADRSQPMRYIRQAHGGRVLEVFSDPMPDGGFIVSHIDITPLARAEAEARQRAAMLKAAMDGVRHGIALYGPDRRLLTANRLAGPSYGLPRLQERVGELFDDLVREQLRTGLFGEGPEAGRTAAEVLAADRSRPIRYQRRLPDGRVIEVASDPTPDGGFVVSHSDVTELAAARAEASERAAILQVMLDNIRHGICYYGPDRRVIAANALAADLGGHRRDFLVQGRSLEELIAEQLRTGAVDGDAEAVARMALALDRGRPARYVRPGQDGRIVEVTSDPTPDGGFVVTTSDITPLARAEAEARRRAGIQQAMLDNIRHGIALFDPEDRVVAVNPVFCAMLGLPPELVAPGRHYSDFVDWLAARGDYGEGETGRAAAAVVKGRDRRLPVRTVRTRPDGQVLEVVSDPIPDGGGWVLTYTDVTEDRRVRAELEAAKEAAEAANRAKSRFLATMSHELRTPLNAVIGFSEAFMADPDPVRGQEFVRSIHEAGRHLLSLIDDILDVARAETTGVSVSEGAVNIASLAEGSVRVMRATAARAGVRVEACLPPSLPRVRADEMRLRQVLLNLLSNAVKFTPQGGTVTLSAALEQGDAPGGGDLVLRVADTGIGMRPEDIPRAFEPFTQLDSSLSRRFPGSGLGLYLSRALAEAQGATLTLESAPGEGTTAVLRIPASRLLLAPQPA